MRKLASLGIVLAYLALVAIGVPILGPVYGPVFVPYFLAAISALFVWLYGAVVGGHMFVSLSMVIMVTVVFPVAMLVAIAWPSYQSWSGVVGAFAATFRASSPIWGLEMFLPLVAASITAVSVQRWRSNKALNPDARQPPRAG